MRQRQKSEIVIESERVINRGRKTETEEYRQRKRGREK